ncbi:MAG: carbamoyl phosphate synthase large subunit [Rickettsiales bacterium]|nr:carbamoyl phosphate synthase large subunit [Rickettsiales bacterium]
MPKRNDIKKILIIGSGPIVIGQACEFDYSGTQACKSLKEEGFEVVLVNSNPATIMTDPQLADATYVEPLTVEILEKIIIKEKPDAVLPTIGGQTALNLALESAQQGIFEKYNVEMLGANEEIIKKAEDRKLFKDIIEKIGLRLPKSIVVYSLEEGLKRVNEIGFPCVIRPAFTLGGTGGGIVNNEEEFAEIAKGGLDKSLISEILIEESIYGWKEFELEVMRDRNDNVVIICSIENLDPMGVHTGDSITVAPAQTLPDREYQLMRNAAIDIMREVGVETGGSNVQFAVNPENGELVVIEVNPRVSRSSALASKATGFPIAKFAAKLAVGYTLDELLNDITKKTPACFEPTIDYCVVKIPRFNFRKFPNNPPHLGTSMKSVGESMAIGRNFKEALQKGIRSLEVNRFGIGYGPKDLSNVDQDELIRFIKAPNPWRLYYVKQGFEQGLNLEQVHDLCKIDRWFLFQIQQLVHQAKSLKETAESIFAAKRNGFSDVQCAFLLNKTEPEFRDLRKKLGILPTYGLVDTCAAEFVAETPYFYSSYETESENNVVDTKKVMILGAGPNRIGQGIEFDYCCVHASLALREENVQSIMVNSNPETVSTDFDISDKLYFEPLTFEDVMNIYDSEKPEGVIVQFGGQTPLNLSTKLEAAGVKILGTSPESIANAEDREKFQAILHDLNLKQPDNGIAYSTDDAIKIANEVEYPVVVRPSFVIGGTSMDIVYNDEELSKYVSQAINLSTEHPVLIDKYLDHATELDVDALSDGNDCVIAGIMEHIEAAGIHSGDSACVLPPFSLSDDILNQIKDATKKLAKKLNVIGLINIQFAVRQNVLYIIEVNPRASRTIPFISKATGESWAKYATKVILGQTIKSLNIKDFKMDYYAVKEAVLPFNKFPQSDILLSPEMKSTGESMGIDSSFELAFYKSQVSAGHTFPSSGKAFLSVGQKDKEAIIEIARKLTELGFTLITTEGTCHALKKHQISSIPVGKISEGGESILDYFNRKEISLAFNTPSGKISNPDEIIIRQQLVGHQIPYSTTIEGMTQITNAIAAHQKEPLKVKPLQEYYD